MRKETVRGREMYDDVTTEEMISCRHTYVALVDIVEAAGARHNWSKLRSALAVAALQCCSSKIGYTKVKN